MTDSTGGDARSVALDRLVAARVARDKAEREWRKAIRDAVEAGSSLRSVGEAAGVSHSRVVQIRRQG